MRFTNIDLDRLEAALVPARHSMKNSYIKDALKTVNIWLTPSPNEVEVIEIFVYFGSDKQKFPLADLEEQLSLLNKMFDNDQSFVYVNKTKEIIAPTGWLGILNKKVATSEDRQYLLIKTSRDLDQEIDLIKERLTALRNPRVFLSLKDHQDLTYLLSKFKINLPDYYI